MNLPDIHGDIMRYTIITSNKELGVIYLYSSLLKCVARLGDSRCLLIHLQLN
jgi:hypothetical protein